MALASFFKKHDNLFLDILAAAFLAAIVLFSAYGVQTFVADIGKALAPPAPAGNGVSFDLTGAASLDFRGLMQSPQSSSTP